MHTPTVRPKARIALGVPAHFIRVNPTSIWGNRTRRA